MNYEIGTVATATVNGKPNVRVMRTSTSSAPQWVAAPNCRHLADNKVANIRPLVVIDPEDREQVGRLAKAYYAAEAEAPVGTGVTPIMQAALSEYADPKPAEPTGLGAVVEDSRGERYVRLRDTDFVWPWATSAQHEARWSEIDAVKVLSEGVVND